MYLGIHCWIGGRRTCRVQTYIKFYCGNTNTFCSDTNIYCSNTNTSVVTQINTAITPIQTVVTQIYTAVTQTYTAVTPIHTEVTQIYTAVKQIFTALKQIYTEVTQIYTAVTHKYTAITPINTAVTPINTNTGTASSKPCLWHIHLLQLILLRVQMSKEKSTQIFLNMTAYTSIIQIFLNQTCGMLFIFNKTPSNFITIHSFAFSYISQIQVPVMFL